jgi:hypothetical protein
VSTLGTAHQFKAHSLEFALQPDGKRRLRLDNLGHLAKIFELTVPARDRRMAKGADGDDGRAGLESNRTAASWT